MQFTLIKTGSSELRTQYNMARFRDYISGITDLMFKGFSPAILVVSRVKVFSRFGCRFTDSRH